MILRQLTLFTLLFLLFSACKKNDSPVGVDILPDEDILHARTFEFSPIISYSYKIDSLRTDENITGPYALIGSQNDPVFGRTDASVVTRFLVPNSGFGIDLGVNPVLDSIVLTFAYYSTSYVGDTSQYLTFNAYPLTEELILDSAYFSNRVPAYDIPNELTPGGGVSTQFRLRTKVKIKNVTYNAHLRIPLKLSFGNTIFNTSTLSNQTNLDQAFKGVYLTASNSILPQPYYGSIAYLNINDPVSGLTFYYHNNSDTLSFRLPATGAARYNHFVHDYQYIADPNLSAQVFSPFDTLTKGSQNVFIQGMSGLHGMLRFPGLENWKDSNVTINKAELIIPISVSGTDYFNTSKFPTIPRLILQGTNGEGKPEDLIENPFTFGGNYDALNKYYVFEIPYTTGKIITGKKNNFKFRIVPLNPHINPNRMVLGGSNNSIAGIKFKIWYTKLNLTK